MVPSSCRCLGFLFVFLTVTLCWLLAAYCHDRLPNPVKSRTRFSAVNAKECHLISNSLKARLQHSTFNLLPLARTVVIKCHPETHGQTDSLWSPSSWELRGRRAGRHLPAGPAGRHHHQQQPRDDSRHSDSLRHISSRELQPLPALLRS